MKQEITRTCFKGAGLKTCKLDDGTLSFGDKFGGWKSDKTKFAPLLDADIGSPYRSREAPTSPELDNMPWHYKSLKQKGYLPSTGPQECVIHKRL